MDSIEVLEVLPGDRAIVSTVGRYRVLDLDTNETFQELEEHHDAELFCSIFNGNREPRVKLLPYREGENYKRKPEERREPTPPKPLTEFERQQTVLAEALTEATNAEVVVEFGRGGTAYDYRDDGTKVEDVGARKQIFWVSRPEGDNELPFVQLQVDRGVDARDCGGLPGAVIAYLQEHLDAHKELVARVTRAYQDANLID